MSRHQSQSNIILRSMWIIIRTRTRKKKKKNLVKCQDVTVVVLDRRSVMIWSISQKIEWNSNLNPFSVEFEKKIFFFLMDNLCWNSQRPYYLYPYIFFRMMMMMMIVYNITTARRLFVIFDVIKIDNCPNDDVDTHTHKTPLIKSVAIGQIIDDQFLLIMMVMDFRMIVFAITNGLKKNKKNIWHDHFRIYTSDDDDKFYDFYDLWLTDKNLGGKSKKKKVVVYEKKTKKSNQCSQYICVCVCLIDGHKYFLFFSLLCQKIKKIKEEL